MALEPVVDHVVGTPPPPPLLGRILGDASRLRLLWVAGGLALTVSVVTTLRRTGQWLLQVYTGERLVLRLRALMFRHVQRLSLSRHDTEGSMDSLYRIQQDAAAIENILVYSGCRW